MVNKVRIRTEEQRRKAEERRKLLRKLRKNTPEGRKKEAAYQRMYYYRRKGILEPLERAKERKKLCDSLRMRRQMRHNNQEFMYNIVDFILDLRGVL